MKVYLTRLAVQGFADALAAEGLEASAERLRQLMRLTQGFADRPLSEFLSVLDNIDLPKSAIAPSSKETVGAVIQNLRNLELALAKVSNRRRLDDLVAFRARLERHESARLSDLVRAVQVQRRGRRGGAPMDAKSLADKLKSALGDEERFAPLFEELNALDAASVARVTDALMSSGSSRSRKKDISRIRERHEALRTLNAKERAMAGKSAA